MKSIFIWLLLKKDFCFQHPVISIILRKTFISAFKPFYFTGSALKDTQAIWSPLADAERKDSLSVNVEFVKFHLSRSRKLNFETPIGKNTESSHATIRFSSNY